MADAAVVELMKKDKQSREKQNKMKQNNMKVKKENEHETNQV